jgi:ribosomal protein L37AE/L43A
MDAKLKKVKPGQKQKKRVCYYCGRKAHQQVGEVWVCYSKDCEDDADHELRLQRGG